MGVYRGPPSYTVRLLAQSPQLKGMMKVLSRQKGLCGLLLPRMVERECGTVYKGVRIALCPMEAKPAFPEVLIQGERAILE